jgi:hypothetical protein
VVRGGIKGFRSSAAERQGLPEPKQRGNSMQARPEHLEYEEKAGKAREKQRPALPAGLATLIA